MLQKLFQQRTWLILPLHSEVRTVIWTPISGLFLGGPMSSGKSLVVYSHLWALGILSCLSVPGCCLDTLTKGQESFYLTLSSKEQQHPSCFLQAAQHHREVIELLSESFLCKCDLLVCVFLSFKVNADTYKQTILTEKILNVLDSLDWSVLQSDLVNSCEKYWDVEQSAFCLGFFVLDSHHFRNHLFLLLMIPIANQALLLQI